jgi:hypothetical protein
LVVRLPPVKKSCTLPESFKKEAQAAFQDTIWPVEYRASENNIAKTTQKQRF